jgi:hypothetical protein
MSRQYLSALICCIKKYELQNFLSKFSLKIMANFAIKDKNLVALLPQPLQ